uniref:Uncharacterized protein n=1 Tax=Anguilla anguilla TaxID=7936 RepID=A0A0E9RNC4_ANGAN
MWWLHVLLILDETRYSLFIHSLILTKACSSVTRCPFGELLQNVLIIVTYHTY